jgi:tape measure domain-containing protein
MVVRELLIGLGFSLDESKLRRADQGIANIKDRATAAIGVLGRMAAVVGLALGAGEVVKIGDEWTNVNARIGLVTKSAEEQAAMQQKVFGIAQKTRQEYAATGDLYFKMARNATQLGASQQDVLDVTETVNKALVVGGASTQEAKATILQLSQALSSGRLQGDELRSLGENASVLMDEVAKYYGVTVGKLKQMGADGELTAEGVFKAILKAKAKMDKEFERMPVTIEQSVTYSLNRIGSLIFGLNKETNVFQHIAKGIIKAVDGIAGAVERTTKLVGGFGNAIKLLILSLASLKLAMFIFAHPVTYLPRLIIMLKGVALAIAGVGKAALMLMLNPLFWKAALIAAAIALIVLAFEDLYYWITGGESVLGDWLGSWEDVKTKAITYLQPFIDGFNRLSEAVKANFIPSLDKLGPAFQKIGETAQKIFYGMIDLIGAFVTFFIDQWGEISNEGQLFFDLLLAAWNFLIDQFILSLRFWTQVFTGDFSGAIETVKKVFGNLLDFAIYVLSEIGGAIGRYVLSKLGWAGQKLAEIAGINFNGGVGGMGSYGVSPAGLASSGGARTVIINSNGDTHIEQNIAGAGPQLANQVGNATAEATGSNSDKLARNLQYSIPSWSD